MVLLLCTKRGWPDVHVELGGSGGWGGGPAQKGRATNMPLPKPCVPFTRGSGACRTAGKRRAGEQAGGAVGRRRV